MMHPMKKSKAMSMKKEKPAKKMAAKKKASPKKKMGY